MHANIFRTTRYNNTDIDVTFSFIDPRLGLLDEEIKRRDLLLREGKYPGQVNFYGSPITEFDSGDVSVMVGGKPTILTGSGKHIIDGWCKPPLGSIFFEVVRIKCFHYAILPDQTFLTNLSMGIYFKHDETIYTVDTMPNGFGCVIGGVTLPVKHSPVIGVVELAKNVEGLVGIFSDSRFYYMTATSVIKEVVQSFSPISHGKKILITNSNTYMVSKEFEIGDVIIVDPVLEVVVENLGNVDCINTSVSIMFSAMRRIDGLIVGCGKGVVCNHDGTPCFTACQLYSLRSHGFHLRAPDDIKCGICESIVSQNYIEVPEHYDDFRPKCDGVDMFFLDKKKTLPLDFSFGKLYSFCPYGFYNPSRLSNLVLGKSVSLYGFRDKGIVSAVQGAGATFVYFECVPTVVDLVVYLVRDLSSLLRIKRLVSDLTTDKFRSFLIVGFSNEECLRFMSEYDDSLISVKFVDLIQTDFITSGFFKIEFSSIGFGMICFDVPSGALEKFSHATYAKSLPGSLKNGTGNAPPHSTHVQIVDSELKGISLSDKILIYLRTGIGFVPVADLISNCRC